MNIIWSKPRDARADTKERQATVERAGRTVVVRILPKGRGYAWQATCREEQLERSGFAEISPLSKAEAQARALQAADGIFEELRHEREDGCSDEQIEDARLMRAAMEDVWEP